MFIYDEEKYTKIKLKKLSKNQLIHIILNLQERLANAYSDSTELKYGNSPKLEEE